MDYLKSRGIDTEGGRTHEEAVYSIAILYNLISNQISDYLKDYQLTLGKFNALVTIRRLSGKEGISQVDISRSLIVTPANMTKLLDKLQNEGLITRGERDGDRRVNIIKITDKGAGLLDDLWPGFQSIITAVTSRLTKTQQKVTATALKRWIKTLVEPS